MQPTALTPPSSKVMKSGRPASAAVSQSVARVGAVRAAAPMASRCASNAASAIL